MERVNKNLKAISPLLLLVLVACGGGGGASSNTPTTPTPPTSVPASEPEALTLVATESAQQHQAIGLVALLPESMNGSPVSWQQTAGPGFPESKVTLLANHSQVVGFDADQAGDYSFEFSVNTDQGVLSDSISLSVQSSNTAVAQVRLDHEVVEQGKVSLRVDANKAYNSVVWQQISGPAVTLDKQDNMLFFDAPSVDYDTLMEFKATLNLSSGGNATDTVYVLVKNAQINQDGIFPKYAEQIVTNSAHPYLADSPYADVLVDCVYSNTRTNPCTFAQLPLIGTEHPIPDIDDILARLVVSHDWMGERFKQYLTQSNVSADMLNLLRATTAIVISYDVRPSFYWSATGAIYLDAENFWLTPQERDSLNDAPDYRSDFGNELQFSVPWTYTHNGEAAFAYYDAAARQQREFADMESEVTWLMYHELAHANDYIGSDRWSSLSPDSDPNQAANDSDSTSDSMSAMYPLTETTMLELAEVSFAGKTATAQQKAYHASDIVSLFSDDNATDFYNYSSKAEDLAMFFQHLMISYRLGFKSVVAILDNNNIVEWGEFSRVDRAHLQQKAKYVIDHILPEVNSSTVLDSLPPVTNMQTGVSFSQSVLAGKQAKGMSRQLDNQIWLKHQRQALHIGRPKAIKN
ncbi:hypothetical protein [Neptunicella sp.]|uniref:hypothetical protein n=1 Tax=Neptunicella sp. TaxID=2125986 RepID=UPI003F68BE5C